jgi:2-methylcitrate dehydratase
MLLSRVIDATAVEAATLARRLVRAAREQVLEYPVAPGAAMWGCPAEARVQEETARSTGVS